MKDLALSWHAKNLGAKEMQLKGGPPQHRGSVHAPRPGGPGSSLGDSKIFQRFSRLDVAEFNRQRTAQSVDSAKELNTVDRTHPILVRVVLQKKLGLQSLLCKPPIKNRFPKQLDTVFMNSMKDVLVLLPTFN